MDRSDELDGHESRSSSLSPTRFEMLQGMDGGLSPGNHFYSEASIKQRARLMKHPDVKRALEVLWTAANYNDEDEIIDHEEYLMMHRKIVLALEPKTLPAEALTAAGEDWKRDSGGKTGIDRDRFLWAWFELADLWTDTMEAHEYVEFLTSTTALLTKRRSDGTVVWKEDKEVKLRSLIHHQ